MNPLLRGAVALSTVVLAAGAGLWAGQTGLVVLPWSQTHSDFKSVGAAKPTGAVIYYRDPDGRPFYAAEPRRINDGRDYVAVLASEDVNFDNAPPVEAASAERRIKYYRNPMGLPDTSPVPKKDSMGMDYIPVYEGEDSDDASVKIAAGKLQRTGVETALVSKHAITRTIKAPAVVQLDERKIWVIAPRFDGFVTRAGNATSATHVKRGEPLVTVFGQDVLDQGARLIIEQATGGRGSERAITSGDTLPAGGVIGAKRRLQNLGVPESYIEAVVRERRVPDTMVYAAEQDGIILERNVVEGQAFKSGDVLFRLADHSVMWVLADIAEGDIGQVSPGQSATITVRSHPGRLFKGTVSLIYPHVMKETRTARVRIELPNADLALLPDMYGEVAIATGSEADVVAVPTSAIIDSGSRQVVLIARGEGRFEPRTVRVGRKGDGYAEILEGVADGDLIVVNGNFLIDAESNLQAALKAFDQAGATKP